MLDVVIGEMQEIAINYGPSSLGFNSGISVRTSILRLSPRMRLACSH